MVYDRRDDLLSKKPAQRQRLQLGDYPQKSQRPQSRAPLVGAQQQAQPQGQAAAQRLNLVLHDHAVQRGQQRLPGENQQRQ
jgi:hypothetical protein